MHTTLSRLAAGAMTFATLAMPMAASAQTSMTMNGSFGLRNPAWSMNRIIQTFTKPGGATSYSYENDSIDKSGFDFGALLSHPCYDTVGETVKEACGLRFGTYGNLKAALESESFRVILMAEFGADILPLLLAVQQDEAMRDAEAANVDPPNPFGDMRSRRSQLWAECGRSHGTARGACYQSNIRLLDNDILPIDGNVYYSARAR